VSESDVETEIGLVMRRVRNTFHVRIRGFFNPIGTGKGRSRNDLPVIWRDSGYKVGVEIGVERAAYSLQILNTMPDVHLHVIDPWAVYKSWRIPQEQQDKNYAFAMRRLQPFIDAGRCTVHRDASTNVAQKFKDGSLDFIFIDGDHSYNAVTMDLIQYVPKVRRGGMVAAHDYIVAQRVGVMDAIDGYTKCNLIAPWFVIREAIATAFWVVT
jgi:hypothetical protein